MRKNLGGSHLECKSIEYFILLTVTAGMEYAYIFWDP